MEVHPVFTFIYLKIKDLELHHILLLVHISILVFTIGKRSDGNKFHLDYFILHISVLFLIPVLYTGIVDFNLDLVESKYTIGGIIHVISIIAIRYNIESAIYGYRVKLKLFHLIIFFLFVLLAVLNQNGYHFYKQPTLQETFYNFEIKNKLTFINFVIIKQSICFILMLEFFLMYIKSTKIKTRVKNLKLINIWVSLYLVLFLLSSISMDVLFFDLLDPIYNSVLLKINSFFAVMNTWYFILLPSLVFALPQIKERVLFKLDKVGESQERINRLFENEKLYLKKNLDLRSVSLLSGLKEKVIRANIKNEMGLNFNDYVNKYRVDYAIGLMKSDYLGRNVITSLGEKAGFSSNQTFYRAFKRLYNDTPANYYKANIKRD